MPQLIPANLALLLMFRSWPVAPSRHTHVGLDWPPPAVAVAETVTVVIPWWKAARKKVGIGRETTACTHELGTVADPPLE
jgi:hypothetical protein